MTDIEKRLMSRQREISQVEAPDDFENRIRAALDKNTNVTGRKVWAVKLAIALIMVVTLGYHFDALAFYGKRLLGYEQVMNGTLNRLNEIGKGQPIGKGHTFENGDKITLDGIMLDDSQLLAFYTVKTPRGDADAGGMPQTVAINGLFTRYIMESSQGRINDQKTEVRYVASFRPPAFYEKNLKMEYRFSRYGKAEVGVIPFKLDRSKAMGSTLKQSIGRTVKVDGCKIRIHSIQASPTRTIVRGSIQSLPELARDTISGERLWPIELNMSLEANKRVIAAEGSRMSTDLDGITFEKYFDALPADLTDVQIRVKSFTTERVLSKRIPLTIGSVPQTATVQGQRVEILNRYESDGDTCIEIRTNKDVVLTRVDLRVDSRRVRLRQTVSDQWEKGSGGLVTHTRTLRFPQTGKDLGLDIRRIRYVKTCDESFSIPLD